MAIEGNNICINALTNAGAGALVPVKDATDSGNVYVDFGGAMTISQLPVDVRTVSSFNTSGINTSILAKEWNDYDIDGVYRPTWYSGYVNLPSNQVTFGSNYGIQPYGLTAAMVDANPTTYGFFRLPTSEEMTVAWFYRDPLFQQYMKSRTPATRPEYMMYVGAGNDVQQLRVSGATVNDPFCLDISGDGARPIVARVREFATLASTRTQKFVGEGQHGIIFAEFGGRFGLGSNEWNSNSLNAWNVLGEDYVTIAPLGNCTIDLNEDVIVADDLPFMAMKRRTTEDSAWGFGYPAVTDPFNTTSHRMTIRSETEREIRVLAGTILDLSGFGQGTVRQEIAFGGKVKLVLEEGAGIRFPAAADVDGGVVLYFNDESQLVFEGINEAMTASRYYTAADSDANRIKLLGKGQIWLNKNAKMKVMGTASVAVQADATTLATDITISLARQSQFLIGDSTLNGGAFQVGNTTAVTDATIDFALIINGADALFHTDREGFFGLGAGLINKPGSKPNGAAVLASNPLLVTTEVAEAALLAEQDYNLVVGKAKLDEDGLPVFSPDNLGTTQDDGSEFDSTAWQIIPLQNVRNITMTLTNGIIEHKSIVTGADSNSSLWAIGKFSGNGIFNLNGGSGAIIRGGGNVMLVPSTLPTDYSFIPVNMWDYVGAMANTGETYSILASAPSLSARVADLSTDNYAVNLTTGVTRFIFTTPASLFGFLGYKDYSTLGGTRYVALGATQFNIVAGYVNKDTQNAIYPVDMTRIMRVTNPTVSAGRVSDGLKYGVLNSDGSGSVNPATFSVPSSIGTY